MSNLITFDQLDEQGPFDATKPFFDVDLTNEAQVLEWLTNTLSKLQADGWMRLEKVKNNYLRYKGIQYIGQVYQPRDVPETRKRYMPQMVLPLIRDAVDEKVARIMESKPTVTVIPKDDEERDKVDAKIAKRFLSHIDYQEKMQEKLRAWLRGAEVAGESFIWPKWNPDKGPMLAETSMLDTEDAEKYSKRSLHIGDVDVKVIPPERVFYEEHPSKDYSCVNYQFLIEYEYTESLKRDYPSKAGDIKPEPSTHFFDYENLEEKPLQGYTRKVTFYHRAHKFLPKGFEACFVNGALLKMGPLPEEYEGELPALRLIMSKNEGELHGESPIEQVRAIAAQVNNVENLVIKQLMLTAHPKWFVEQGSVDTQQLNNDTGIVFVARGASKPVLAQANPVSPQLFQHSKDLQEKFYSFAKSNSVVRGEPPPGVSAFVALQYASEAESRRLSTEVAYFSEGVVSIYQKILKICGLRYKPNQNRTLMIAGKDNRFNLMKYDPSSLKKNFSVILQNSSGLPDSRSGRIQAILETEERFPGMVPREQVAEMLGFAQSEKFLDVAGAAARAAEEENEIMLDGKGMIEPAEHEDHITHWRVHTAAIQDVAFKTKVQPEIRGHMLSHLLATEMMMADQMMKSPTFALRIQNELPQFPMLFEMPLPTPPMAPPPEPGGTPQNPEAMPAMSPTVEEQGQMMDAAMTGEMRPQEPLPPPTVEQPL